MMQHATTAAAVFRHAATGLGKRTPVPDSLWTRVEVTGGPTVLVRVQSDGTYAVKFKSSTAVHYDLAEAIRMAIEHGSTYSATRNFILGLIL